MKQHSHSSDFLATIEVLHQLSHEFKDLLTQEKEILSTLDLPALEKITSAKKDLVGKIIVAETTLHKLLTPIQNASLTQRVDATIAASPSPDMTQKTWQELMTLLKECRTLNNINHSIVQASLLKVRKKMDILLHCLNNAHTYNENGELT